MRRIATRRRRMHQRDPAALAGGGGFPEDGLVVKYHDATNNFTVGTSQWVSSLDGGPTLSYSFNINVNDPPSAVSNGRIVFPNFGGLTPSQAIFDEMNVDDLTFAFGVRVTNGGFVYGVNTSGLSARFGVGAGGCAVQSNRGGGIVSAADAISVPTDLHVVIGTYRRGGKVTIQVDARTPVDSTGNDSDAALSLSTTAIDGFPYGDGMTGNGEVGFIMAWARALTESEVAAVLAEVTDNAEYGMGGYSPS